MKENKIGGKVFVNVYSTCGISESIYAFGHFVSKIALKNANLIQTLVPTGFMHVFTVI